MARFIGPCMDLITTAEPKNCGALNGSDSCLGGSKWVEEKAPPDPHQRVYSGIGIIFYRFQMRDLEMVSDTMDGVLAIPLKGYGYSI